MPEHITAKAILADKGYDSNAVIEKIEAAGAIALIPSKSNRKVKPSTFTSTLTSTRCPSGLLELYKERNLVERFFNRLKHWRGLATRYEKTAESYLAMVQLVCARLGLTAPSSS